MMDRATKRRLIAEKLTANIARLKKEVEDRRGKLEAAKAMVIARDFARPWRRSAGTLAAFDGSWFAAWSQRAPGLARAIGALARAQKLLPAASERAARAATLEREKRARIDRIRAANVGLMKRLDALKADAPSIQSRWEKERAGEDKRIADRVRQLNKRIHKDTRGEAKVAENDIWWRLPKLPEPVVQPDMATSETGGIDFAPPREGLIPGTFKIVDPSRLGGIVDRPRLPKVWSAHHVGLRLIEAHKVLARLPGNIWPKQYGKAWPEYQREWGELVVQAGAGTLFLGRNAIARGATADEVARMGAAICWPMQFLSHSPVTAADVNAWASETTEEDFEHNSRGAPWEALQSIADALNAAKEIVR